MKQHLKWKVLVYVGLILLVFCLKGAATLLGWPWLEVLARPCEQLKAVFEQDHVMELVSQVVDLIVAKLFRK